MTKQESLRILDKCIEYLDSLSDDEIDKLANEANEYMAKPFEENATIYQVFEIVFD